MVEYDTTFVLHQVQHMKGVDHSLVTGAMVIDVYEVES